MADYLDAEGCPVDMPAPARNLANHLGTIVSAVTSQSPGELRQTSVRCRRRPSRRPCVGRIRAIIEVGSGRIAWECPACADNGIIHHWAGTPWDQTPEGRKWTRPEDRTANGSMAGRIVRVTYTRFARVRHEAHRKDVTAHGHGHAAFGGILRRFRWSASPQSPVAHPRNGNQMATVLRRVIGGRLRNACGGAPDGLDPRVGP
jgi:hypothetical protein